MAERGDTHSIEELDLDIHIYPRIGKLEEE